ncbi:hypothetical protein ABZS66_37360 [Dactylosporangium sp. NPDC005572]|uniref:hypothetical protein n=1 Tax=Dactylosporangium sp. NPDC005572 TaxID=3156889 RepID=UPI0033BBBAE2
MISLASRYEHPKRVANLQGCERELRRLNLAQRAAVTNGDVVAVLYLKRRISRVCEIATTHRQHAGGDRFAQWVDRV